MLRRRGPSPFPRIAWALLLVLMAFGVWRLGRFLRGTGMLAAPTPPPAAPANLEELFGPAQLLWLAGDVNGDTRPDGVALSPLAEGERRIALLINAGDWYRLAGPPQRLQWPEVLPELSLVDLPGAPGSLLATMRLASGEEQFQAFTLDPARGLVPLEYYRLVAPQRAEPSLILVDKHLNVLYYYRNGGLELVARTATGRDRLGPPSTKNRFTPEGRFRISILQKDPSYTSPDGKQTWAGGGEENPLGTRWMGFPVLKNDNDVGWIFGIQGTNDPASIGLWASDGSIRLSNTDAEQLFDLIREGTPLEIR